MNQGPTSADTNRAAAKTQQAFRHAHAAMAEEHVRIMAIVDVLRDVSDPSRHVRTLEELHTLLANHFAREQFPGGLYEAMGAFGSRWHEELRELIRDHCMILSDARSVLERARQATPQTQDTLQTDLIALLDLLCDHEQKEHRLAERLQQA